MKLFVLVLMLVPLAGCLNGAPEIDDCWRDVEVPDTAILGFKSAPYNFADNADTLYANIGFNGTHWPDLSGHNLVILDHGAFDWAFGAAKPLFESLTGATVTHLAADDAGTALQLAIQDRQAGGGSFDVLYGVDNVLMHKAIEADIFDSYTPLLGASVGEQHRFIPDSPWVATPVDFGYIAVNGDVRESPALESFDDLVDQADTFVTMDPRFSSPGLGFLISTVSAFGPECYLGYWEELLDNGVTVTNGWSEGYEQHFTGGYGQWNTGFKGDKDLVTSYTTSPAYELYYEYDQQNTVLTAPQSTFKQVQTMGILQGADRVAAEAWIEFTMTDDFQSLAAGYNAIYPVISNEVTETTVSDVYAGRDPTPGSFLPATLSTGMLGPEVDGWVADWVDLYEAKRA